MIPFMKLKWASLAFSIAVITGGFFYVENSLGGFKEGIDFAGGIKMELSTDEDISIEDIRNAMKIIGVSATVQEAGKDLENLVKIEIGGHDEEELQKEAEKAKENLTKTGYAVNSIDFVKYRLVETLAGNDQTKIKFLNDTHVGPTFGTYLRKSAIKLLLITLVLITLYITFRFRFVFAIGAMAALLHDLFMTMVVIGIFQVPLSTPIIAALLTILGYSINDTIVIFDRIRENQRGSDKMNFEGQVNHSINQSISRTLITSLTTMIAIVAVYILAKDTLKDMAEVLIWGIVIGTYSSSFIASPIVVLWNRYVNKVR